MRTGVAEQQVVWAIERVGEVARRARAGLLYRKMTAAEFWALMDQGDDAPRFRFADLGIPEPAGF